MPDLFNRLNFSRRNMLLSLLTLSQFLLFRNGKAAPVTDENETVIMGRWVLKKSDLV